MEKNLSTSFSLRWNEQSSKVNAVDSFRECWSDFSSSIYRECVVCEWGYKAKLCHCTKFKLISKWGKYCKFSFNQFICINRKCNANLQTKIGRKKRRFSVYKIINTASSAAAAVATAGCTLFYTQNKKMSKRQTNNNEPSCIPCTHTTQ